MNFFDVHTSIPELISCKQVHLNSKIKEVFAERAKEWENIQHNETLVHVYRIRYRSAANEVVGFLIEPKEIHAPLPCIVYNRGGTRDFGMIKLGHLFGTMAEIASWGYIVIASQYSGNDGGTGNDEFGGNDIQDIEHLYPILAQYHKADTSRIGMYGGSRGGMMTYQMLTKVSWIKAAVVRAGLSNIFRNERERGRRFKNLHTSIFGSSKEERIRRSALYWPEKFPKNVPLLLMHGSADWRVSPLDSIDLSKKLLEQKVPHKLVLFEGADHGITEFHEEVLHLTKNWFDTYVKNLHPLPNIEKHGD